MDGVLELGLLSLYLSPRTTPAGATLWTLYLAIMAIRHGPRTLPFTLVLIWIAALFWLPVVVHATEWLRVGAVDLRERSDVTRQAITKHLEIFAEAGLVSSHKAGRERVWQLEPKRLSDAHAHLEAISKQWDDRPRSPRAPRRRRVSRPS